MNRNDRIVLADMNLLIEVVSTYFALYKCVSQL